jgi:hypothetical protein
MSSGNSRCVAVDSVSARCLLAQMCRINPDQRRRDVQLYLRPTAAPLSGACQRCDLNQENIKASVCIGHKFHINIGGYQKEKVLRKGAV